MRLTRLLIFVAFCLVLGLVWIASRMWHEERPRDPLMDRSRRHRPRDATSRSNRVSGVGAAVDANTSDRPRCTVVEVPGCDPTGTALALARWYLRGAPQARWRYVGNSCTSAVTEYLMNVLGLTPVASLHGECTTAFTHTDPAAFTAADAEALRSLRAALWQVLGLQRSLPRLSQRYDASTLAAAGAPSVVVSATVPRDAVRLMHDAFGLVANITVASNDPAQWLLALPLADIVVDGPERGIGMLLLRPGTVVMELAPSGAPEYGLAELAFHLRLRYQRLLGGGAPWGLPPLVVADVRPDAEEFAMTLRRSCLQEPVTRVSPLVVFDGMRRALGGVLLGRSRRTNVRDFDRRR